MIATSDFLAQSRSF